jgi:hypothetical protein
MSKKKEKSGSIKISHETHLLITEFCDEKGFRIGPYCDSVLSTHILKVKQKQSETIKT